MSFLEFAFEDTCASMGLTPEQLACKVRDQFPDAVVILKDRFAAEAQAAAAYFEKRGTADQESHQTIIKSLRSKADRNGPYYKFQLVLDGNIEVSGAVNPKGVIFRYEGSLSPESEDRVLIFLRTFRPGKIRKAGDRQNAKAVESIGP